MTTKTELTLSTQWEARLNLHAEGDKLHAEGDKLWAEGDKLRAEGDKLWAEGILSIFGNIKLSWKINGNCVIYKESGETEEYEYTSSNPK